MVKNRFHIQNNNKTAVFTSLKVHSMYLIKIVKIEIMQNKSYLDNRLGLDVNDS